MTWTWECLVSNCGETGVEADYDAAIEAAQQHNAQLEHQHPAISYCDNDPPTPANDTPSDAATIAAEMSQTIANAVASVPDDGTVADLKSAILGALGG